MNFGIRGKHGRAQQAQNTPRKQNFITREATIWWNRLLGAAKEGSLADQDAMYDSHRTTRDFVCNAVGTGAWGAVFPLLTIVVTQLAGAEQAGMFSMAFITALLLMFVGNYGVRTFQVSDLEETHSFSDYQVNRLATCVIMLVAAFLYCTARGYGADMFTICMAMVVYKGIDALADVYEGRLQQVDKLYLAGISLAVRSVACVVVFSLALVLTRSLGIASVAMAVVAVITLIVLTLPLALFETERSRRWSTAGVMGLFRQCFAPFLALFLFNLIENMPKFVMEGSMTYDNQALFQRDVLPRAGHSFKRGPDLQAAAGALGKRMGRPNAPRPLRFGHRGNAVHRGGHDRRRDCAYGVDRRAAAFVYVRHRLRTHARPVLRHGRSGRNYGRHRLLIPGHHGVAPRGQRYEACI